MIYTVLFIVTGFIAGSEAVTCDPIKFDQCQQLFAKAVGGDDSLDWKRPADLQVAIQNVYINGLPNNTRPGLIGVCNAYNDFMQCLYDDGFNYKDCFDANWLLSLNTSLVTPYDTQQYVGVMSQVSYQCGAGFYPAIDNWACVQSVYQNQNATLTNCINSFYINARGNAARACTYFNTGLECYENAFRYCQDEIMYFGCESFRVQASIGYAGCNQACEVRRFYGQPGMKIVKSERFQKYEDLEKQAAS